jgi:hypothetical protein
MTSGSPECCSFVWQLLRLTFCELAEKTWGQKKRKKREKKKERRDGSRYPQQFLIISKELDYFEISES